MTTEQMHKAGRMVAQTSISEDDLNLAIEATDLVLAYLEGKGLDWYLAITPLKVWRNQLESYRLFRGWKKMDPDLRGE